MAISLISTATGSGIAVTSVTSSSITGQTDRLAILYVAMVSGTATITSVTGPTGATWTRLLRQVQGAITSEVWYATFASTNTGTVTVNFSAAISAQIQVDVISGHTGIPTAVTTYNGNGTTTTSMGGGNATQIQAAGTSTMYGGHATFFHFATGAAGTAGTRVPASYYGFDSSFASSYWSVTYPASEYYAGMATAINGVVRPLPNYAAYMRREWSQGAAQDHIGITTYIAAASSIDMEPVLADDTFQFNSLVLNAGGTALPQYDIYRIDGLEGTPLDHNEESRDGADGGFYYGQYYTYRSVAIEGSIYSTPSTVQSTLDSFKNTFAPTIADVPLYIKRTGTGLRKLYARVADLKLDEDTQRNLGIIPYLLQLIAQDPFTYGPPRFGSASTAASMSSAYVYNAGNAPVWPLLVITSLGTTGSITAPNGFSVGWSGATAGNQYIIDTKNRRMLSTSLAGADVSSLLDTRTWIPVDGGAAVLFSTSASPITPVWQDAYR